MPLSGRWGRWSAGAGLALGVGSALLGSFACAGNPPSGTELDLFAHLPAAESWCETAEIDLGTATPDPALLGGWGAPSRAVSDYLWGAGERSELIFRRADARGFRIRLRGWAHPRLPEGQDVDLALNGVALARIRLGSAPETVEVEVPEGRARPGRNALVLAYPVVVPTGRYGRPLGPAWDGLRFDSARAGSAPRPQTAAVAPIELPEGCGIDFLLEPPVGAQLVASGIEERGGARLEADVECEGAPASFGGLVPARGGRRVLALSGGVPAVVPCRVTLRAVPGASPGAPGTVRIGAAALQVEPVPATASAAPVRPRPTTRALAPAMLSAPARPSFVIYLVDALRADRLGVYGGPPGLTPALDRFAGRAVRFEQARAQSSWTRPAVASLFTGLTPLRHGATDVESRLPDEVSTVAERLRARGYRTGYITANGNTTAAFGFDQGFDFFRWLYGRNEGEKVRWPQVHATAREFFARLPPSMPFFLVLHTVETHAPYLPSPRHRARWAAGADPRLGERPTLVELPGRAPGEEIVRQVRRLYDAEVADADEGFADLLGELERCGRSADTSVLLLSDHGEELFDHGQVEHGRTLYEEQLRVPMLWSLPGDSSGRRVAPAIDQIDVAPTLLELAGLPAAADLPGRSFAAALRGGEPPPARPSGAWLDRLHFHQEAVAGGGFKLIRNLVPTAVTAVADEELFGLDDDPDEQRPLGEEKALRREALRAQLRSWRLQSGAALDGGAAEIDDRLRRELQALGYIQ